MLTIRSSDDVDLAVHRLPSGTPPEGRDAGSGAPVLLAHATGFCATVWEPLAAALGADPSWAVDFRGHGSSTLPADGELDWDGMADDVLAAIDALELQRPVGLGHSMGGAALVLAEQRRPGTFAALWCYEPIIFPPVTVPAGGGSTLADSALRRRPTFPSAAAALANFASKPPMDAFDPRALEAYVRGGFEEAADGTVTLRCRPADESQTYRWGQRHGAFADLAKVACPVVVARGGTDGMSPAQFAEAIVAELPNGRLVTYGDLGHFGPLEAPDRLAADIAALLPG